MSNSLSPTPFLFGKKVYLRAVADSDIQDLANWINGPEVFPFFQMFKPVRDQDMRAVIENICKAENRQVFSICLHSGQLIGVVWLNEINWVNRNAVTAAYIGEAENRGKGYGVDAKMMLCYHCFCTLNLNKLCSSALECNSVSLHYNEKCGYREEGRRRAHYFRGGKYWDVIETGLLRSEWLPLWEKYRASDPAIRVPEPKIG